MRYTYQPFKGVCDWLGFEVMHGFDASASDKSQSLLQMLSSVELLLKSLLTCAVLVTL